MANVSLAQLTMDKMQFAVMPKSQCLKIIDDVMANSEQGTLIVRHESWGSKILIDSTGHEVFVGLFQGRQAHVRFKKSLLTVTEA